MNLDTTRLMAVRPSKHLNNCKVSDLDPLSRSSTPREIEVVLPDNDGSKVLAMWYGQPYLAVDDYVRIRRDTSDTNIYVVEGFGGGSGSGQKTILDKLDATAAPTTGDDTGDGYSVGSLWIDVTNDDAYLCVDASSGAAVWEQINDDGSAGTAAWPVDQKAMIDSTEYASVTAADTAASAGDVVKLGGGEFDEQVTWDGTKFLIGSGEGTVISNSTSPTFTNNTSGAVLEKLTVENDASSTSKALVIPGTYPLSAVGCKFYSHGTGTNTAVEATAAAELRACELLANSGTTNNGFNQLGNVTSVLTGCHITGDVKCSSGTLYLVGCYVDGDITTTDTGTIMVNGGKVTGDVTETSGTMVLSFPQVDGTVGAGVQGAYLDSSYDVVDL